MARGQQPLNRGRRKLKLARAVRKKLRREILREIRCYYGGRRYVPNIHGRSPLDTPRIYA